MKKIFSFLLLLSFPFVLKAQSYWAQGTGGNDVDETMSICSDNSGNIISVGYFTNTVAFGTSTTLSSASMGIPDIFISKSNSSGVILWAVRAGGPGSDRAISVKTDAAGNIYITGFYYGNATFGAINLNSANGSQDIFIGKLSPAGNFLWVVSAGGNMADIGNAIELDASGNVIVTGQFEGAATFGTATFTSMTNPQTGNPSIDVFTAKYSSNGTFIWARQGSAKYTDRGIAVVCDNSGNSYVCGQFSDTITFNQVHNNPIMNAIFLIKYDASGNEVWFRHASGTFSIAYSLAINSSNEIYMTGDFQGTLAFYGSINNFLNDTYTNRVFLAKYDNNGTFIWASSESSNNYISSRAVALDPAGSPYIVGEFGCTLNKFADIFGQGTFNSIGFKDIFTAKYGTAGQRQWVRNFGGPGNDKAHGILVNTADNPIICGSYEKKILWPVNSLAITNTNYLVYTPQSGNASYCSDFSYGIYNGMRCNGYSDGFVAMAVDISRQPYDYYHRTGVSCLRNFLPGCIDSLLSFSCPDTLAFCTTGTLYANTFTGSGLSYSIGPSYSFQWSTSAVDTLYTTTISATNYYSVTMTTKDGCYTSTDSIYVIVHPNPQAPTITDDHGVNNQHPQCGIPIASCQPDTILLTGGNINGNYISWYQNYTCFPNSTSSSCNMGGTFITNNDSLYVTTSGYYNVVLTNQYGCKNSNCVKVQLDPQLPPLVPKSQIQDTIVVCQNDLVLLTCIDSITGVSGPFYSLTNSWTSNPSLYISSNPNYLTGSFYAQTSGTYIVNLNIIYINTCDTQYYSVQDTFYLLVKPKPTVTVNITGPIYLCPGDTIVLHITTIPSTTQNTVITQSPAIDSIIVTTPGNFYVSAIITDTITGCSSTTSVWHQVVFFPNPVISTIPLSGLICPNDSVLITCNTPGASYQWIGPNGPISYNTQSIYQSVPGFYHCIVTGSYGCVLTSNTVELKQYNTPYLLPIPTSVVCQGQSVTLQVITNDSTLIQWLPPLSGGGTKKVVWQSGVYSCNVTMCGITTLCSFSVTVSQPLAQITGSSTLCPGDSALLVANPGMSGYQWLPLSSFSSNVYAQAGTYTLITTDGYGCTATATHTITLDNSVPAPSGNNTTICAGNNATLYASGIGAIEWYSSLTSGVQLYTGNTFTTPPLYTQTTYYIATSNSSGCHSARNPITVFINPSIPSPTVNSGSPVCEGTSLQLQAFSSGATSYSWIGPSGFSSSLSNPVISPAMLSNSGTYTVFAYLNGCGGMPSFLNITVNPVPVLSIGNDTAICNNTTWNLSPSGNYSSYLWQDSSTANSYLVDSTGLYYLTVANIYGCKASDSVKIIVVDCAPAIINVFSPNGDGVNDIFTLAGHYFKELRCEIYDRWGRKIFLWNDPKGGWDGTNIHTKRPVESGTYYYVAYVTAHDGKEIFIKGYVTLIR